MKQESIMMNKNHQTKLVLNRLLNHSIKGLLIFTLLGISSNAQSKSPGYDYLSLGVGEFDVDSSKIDGPTLGFGWLFAESFNVSGSISKYSGELNFQNASSELDISQAALEVNYTLNSNWLINVGVQRDTNKFFGVDESSTSVQAGAGFFSETSYSYFDVIVGAVSVDGDFFDTQSRDFSDDGAYAQLFYRHYPTENLELELQVEHFGLSQSLTSGYLSLTYKNLLPFDLYAGLSLGDSEGVFAGIRLSFD
jgi:hypothetical protein